MVTPEPHPYRQLNYPVNNLEQNFDQAKKIQVRANIGIPTSVDQTNKVLGVTAATGELGWIPQSGGSSSGDNLFVPSDWLEAVTSVWNTSPDISRVKSANLPTVAEFLVANGTSGMIIPTVFAKPQGGNISTFPPRVVPFDLQITYTDSENTSRTSHCKVCIPMGFSAKDVGTYFGGSGQPGPISPFYKGVTAITNIQVENYTVGITDVSEALATGILFTVIK